MYYYFLPNVWGKGERVGKEFVFADSAADVWPDRIVPLKGADLDPRRTGAWSA